jgi:hypothetical protein
MEQLYKLVQKSIPGLLAFDFDRNQNYSHAEDEPGKSNGVSSRCAGPVDSYALVSAELGVRGSSAPTRFPRDPNRCGAALVLETPG